MPAYHLYFLRNGMLVGSEDIEAADDDEAVKMVRLGDRGDAVEVWDENRRLRVLAPIGPANATSPG